MKTAEKKSEFVVNMEPLIKESQLEPCAKCYCEIWKEAPWNENFWTVEVVTEDIRSAMRQPDFKGIIAWEIKQVDEFYNPNRSTGFTWGYRVDEQALLVISGNEIIARYGRKPTFYIAELGVARKTRGGHLAQSMSEKLINHVFEKGFTQIILRTDVQAIPARALYVKLGFQELPLYDAEHESRTYWLLKA